METVAVPVHNKHATYNASAKGKKRRSQYRHDNSKYTTDTKYLSRHFRAWDGEGVTYTAGEAQTYVMLACRVAGQTQIITDPKGLRTTDIFEFLLDNVDGDAINVIYGGGYDFNMFLVDLSEEELRRVYEDKFYVWHGYRIGWQRGKAFQVRRVDKDGKAIGNNALIYDVVSFFQTSFVNACDAYLGDRFTNREMIVRNKAQRNDFDAANMDAIAEYNDAELDNLIALMVELRDRLNKAGLRPSRWDGPGAIAAALLQKHDVKKAQAECPPAVAEAARYAYAGGRFEVIRHGHVERPAFEYDVNSAYPAALRYVPDLTDGEWIRHEGEYDADFALYHIEWKCNSFTRPGPFFRRSVNGTIFYPVNGTGWYWTPEYRTGKRYCSEFGYGTYRVLETWEFRPAKGARAPFDFIEPLYNKRRALKKAGDGAHVGIKLGLNSLYGKLAQQVGWERRNGILRIPPFHQLEWAGYTTSYCRARVLEACLPKIDSVIAFETDAVFMAKELDVPLTSDLGDFEEVRFENLSYIQSGLYFGDSETNISKTRGVDRGNLHRSTVLKRMGAKEVADRMATVSLTRFIGAGIALSQSFDRWRKWETAPKRIKLQPSGKRVHNDFTCPACTGAQGIALGNWHTTLCPIRDSKHSCEFPVEWINPNPNMDILGELRDEPTYE